MDDWRLADNSVCDFNSSAILYWKSTLKICVSVLGQRSFNGQNYTIVCQNFTYLWRHSRTHICVFLHRMKYLVITANDTASPPSVTPPDGPLHPDLTWPTPGGVNETEARRICQQPVLQSPVYEVCRNFTERRFELITRSCMLDLQVIWFSMFPRQNFLFTILHGYGGILKLSCRW